jgi:predicted nucleic acid-binding protein
LPRRSARTAKTVSERPAAKPLGFFDASAIAKAYVREPETADVRRRLAEGFVVVSRLTQVEVTSAITRQWRERVLSSAQRTAAIEAFLADLDRWIVIELTPAVARRAGELLAAHHLRAGDAIQLASALEAQDQSASMFGRFVTYDARLSAAARTEGLATTDY